MKKRKKRKVSKDLIFPGGSLLFKKTCRSLEFYLHLYSDVENVIGKKQVERIRRREGESDCESAEAAKTSSVTEWPDENEKFKKLAHTKRESPS